MQEFLKDILFAVITAAGPLRAYCRGIFCCSAVYSPGISASSLL